MLGILLVLKKIRIILTHENLKLPIPLKKDSFISEVLSDGLLRSDLFCVRFDISKCKYFSKH